MALQVVEQFGNAARRLVREDAAAADQHQPACTVSRVNRT